MNSIAIQYFVLFCLFGTDCEAANIYNNEPNVVITGEPDRFFGYAVHLQQGKPSRVIIGAPKHGQTQVGSVYDCAISNLIQLPSSSCESYSIPLQDSTRLNDLFGASIDGGTKQGDTIMIGAPKYTIFGDDDSYYTYGGAFNLTDLKKNSMKYPRITEPAIEDNYYRYAFAEYGFSTYYISNSEFLFGAPGHTHWRGQMYHLYQTDRTYVPEARRPKQRKRVQRAVQEVNEAIMRIFYTNKDEESGVAPLAGYAVAAGNFFGHPSYVIGMPNDNNMMGTVKIYYKKTLELTLMSDDEQIGEHFGSALAVADINGDGFDDLIVGAPNYSKMDSFDNGQVYCYLSDSHGNLKLQEKKSGMMASRFGTTITNLGRFGSDRNEAVAISAPYEEGKGAVHIYIWIDGKFNFHGKIQLDQYQALGFGLSRGVDIDFNGTPDLAIGDYRSNKVVIIKGRDIFYYDLQINHQPLYVYDKVKTFSLELCISTKDTSEVIETEMVLDLDPRFQESSRKTTSLRIKQKECKNYTWNFHDNIQRREPLKISVTLNPKDCQDCPVHSPMRPKKFEKKIPFYYCTSTICKPKLHLTFNFKSTTIIVGEEDFIKMQLNIENQQDPAFDCTLNIITNPPVEVTPGGSGSKCRENPCMLDQILKQETISYNLDFADFASNSLIAMHITAEAKCTNETTAITQSLHLNYKHNVVVNPSSFSQLYDPQNGTIHHIDTEFKFLITNEGPSFLQAKKYKIKVPRNAHTEQIVEIYKPTESDKYELATSESFDTVQVINDLDSDPEGVQPAKFGIVNDLPEVISCNNPDVECMTMNLTVKNLPKNTIAIIAIRVKIKAEAILPNFKTSFTVECVLQEESTGDEYIAKVEVIDRNADSNVHIWIYIVIGIVIAVILLVGVVFVLKKVHFFNRPMHDKLVEEVENELYNTMSVELRNTPQNEEADVKSVEEHDEIKTSS